MKIFYGWVIVAVGIVVGCIGMGGLMSFGVFLQPMSDSLGWSRAGIASGSTVAFLGMGAGGFLWGSLYDRYGARVVVLCGGVLEGAALWLRAARRVCRYSWRSTVAPSASRWARSTSR